MPFSDSSSRAFTLDCSFLRSENFVGGPPRSRGKGFAPSRTRTCCWRSSFLCDKDIDDTLYPFSSGLSGHVTKNIQEYMLQKLGIQEDKVPELCVSLYKVYGTTMAGLKAIGYDFDYDDFHGFVHGRLPYNMLKPDPILRGTLLSLPIRKILFTNSDEAHANRALHRLGLEDIFERIISFETLNSTKSNNFNSPDSKDGSECKQSSTGIFDFYEYLCRLDANIVLLRTPVVCKPFQDSFEKVFKIADIGPQRTLFFDNSVHNIQTGKSLGLHTVLTLLPGMWLTEVTAESYKVSDVPE